ncbi:ABC transporter permease [Sedimenticola selenatireducens]|uniref:FtsX-like permease family protein n=1 Tax=Sedimenticola selenatireducens TaxID=191960 RepID=A0A557SEG3_9GAMM|nr:ABC transporter permease [Sedimenticola selenatireducens]TVO75810.1 FtsX-like permease family protein [Sedimenticola selenatireducens]TVT63669.1 MAG: FtsX-like permease family protein [Sedimenticola selenatireducens]
MLTRDFIKLALGSVSFHRTRSLLTALGIAVGIAAVVLLTSIGEGINKFVLSEFTQFGTNIIAINPGKSETFGISGALVNSVRPLSLEDAETLARLPHIQAVVPLAQGNAAIEFNQRSRRTYIYGVNQYVPQVWKMKPALGRFLPDDDPRFSRSFVVLGSKVRDELFKQENPLGERIRIGGESFRVIGVLESKGQLLGFDLDDAVYIPTYKAMALFDQEGLMEIDLLYREGLDSAVIAENIKQHLIKRHGNEDFTITTQDQMLDTLGSVLNILTLAVGALGSISLLVGGVGILTIMTISVNERRAEVGLFRALGARKQQILWLFIGEAVVLACLGGIAGLIIGAGGAWLLHVAIPALPTHTSWGYVLAAEGVAAVIGLIAGVTPAWRAARLDPIEALRDE